MIIKNNDSSLDLTGQANVFVKKNVKVDDILIEWAKEKGFLDKSDFGKI